ncbi:hypothetical protein MTO96_044942 [Rhipicephalus appendiculatus]
MNSVRHRHPRSRNASLIQDPQTSLSAGQTSHLRRKVCLNQLINRVVQTQLQKPLCASRLRNSQNPLEPDPDERINLLLLCPSSLQIWNRIINMTNKEGIKKLLVVDPLSNHHAYS